MLNKQNGHTPNAICHITGMKLDTSELDHTSNTINVPSNSGSLFCFPLPVNAVHIKFENMLKKEHRSGRKC